MQIHKSVRNPQAAVMSLRQRTRRILHNSWLLWEILPLPYLLSSHGKCTSAREAEEISSPRVPETLPHSLLNLKTTNHFASSAATSDLAVQPHYCSYGQFHLSSGTKIWSVLLCLSSHHLELMKPFRLASASTVVISSPITSFLPLLPIQPHHYWKLRLYSSSLRICLHYL